MANQTVTISIPEMLVDAMDKKVACLDSNRSQYLRRLVREDLGISLFESENPESDADGSALQPATTEVQS